MQPHNTPPRLGLGWWLRTLLPLLAAAGICWGAWQYFAAEGARYQVGSQELADALEIAAAYWGENPCGSELVMRSADAHGNLAEAAPQLCLIHYPSETADRPWGMICSVIVHEHGHLVGVDHSSRPGSVMQPTAAETIPQCQGKNPQQTLQRGQAWIRGGQRPRNLPVRVGWDRARGYTLRIYEDNLYLRRTQRNTDDRLLWLTRIKGAQGGCGPGYRRISWQPLQQNQLRGILVSVAAQQPRLRRVCAMRSRGRLIARARMVEPS